MAVREDPIAKLSRWISNLEAHESKLVTEINDLKTAVAGKETHLTATRSWLKKLVELQALLEATNKESVELLEDDNNDEHLKAKHGTHFERIQAFFASVKNEPQTAAEIAEGTKIPRTSLSAVLYRTFPNEFVAGYVTGKRGKVWSLKNPPPESEIGLPPPPDASDSTVDFDSEPPSLPDGEEIPF